MNAAESLARVERALRSPATPPDDLPRLGWEQQDGYRALGAHPEWVPDVLARLPGDVQPVVSANANAVQALRGLAQPQPALPNWKIVAPPPVDELMGYYHEAEARSGIPWAYLAAIHLVETRLSRIVGDSVAGAQGPMQFIPETWARYGQGDVHDTHDAILAAGRFLAARGGPANMFRALHAYNPDQRYVTAVDGYARLMLADERAFLGYYQWQVYYATVDGTFLLPEGYPGEKARPVTPDGGSREPAARAGRSVAGRGGS